MGIAVIVYGKSGTGKSRSLKNFGSDEIFLANIQGKPLPFKGKFEHVYVPKINTDGKGTSAVDNIIYCLKQMPCKTAVIDDAGYLMTQEFMAKHKTKAGSAQFDLYNDIADLYWKLINTVTRDLPEDVIVYILMHEVTSDYGETKLRTIGNLLDSKVCIEGMASICIRCMTDGKKHWFATQNGGFDISKSPEDMLPAEMENDLKAVDIAIRKYYGWLPDEPETEPDEPTQEETPETFFDIDTEAIFN